jgi:hypothetical protein
MAVFWDVAPRSLVDTDRRFRIAYCLHILHTRRRENLKPHQSIQDFQRVFCVHKYIQFS